MYASFLLRYWLNELRLNMDSYLYQMFYCLSLLATTSIKQLFFIIRADNVG